MSSYGQQGQYQYGQQQPQQQVSPLAAGVISSMWQTNPLTCDCQLLNADALYMTVFQGYAAGSYQQQPAQQGYQQPVSKSVCGSSSWLRRQPMPTINQACSCA